MATRSPDDDLTSYQLSELPARMCAIIPGAAALRTLSSATPRCNGPTTRETLLQGDRWESDVARIRR